MVEVLRQQVVQEVLLLQTKDMQEVLGKGNQDLQKYLVEEVVEQEELVELEMLMELLGVMVVTEFLPT